MEPLIVQRVYWKMEHTRSSTATRLDRLWERKQHWKENSILRTCTLLTVILPGGCLWTVISRTNKIMVSNVSNPNYCEIFLQMRLLSKYCMRQPTILNSQYLMRWWVNVLTHWKTSFDSKPRKNWEKKLYWRGFQLRHKALWSALPSCCDVSCRRGISAASGEQIHHKRENLEDPSWSSWNYISSKFSTDLISFCAH